jgi:hypothetical protein
LDEHPVNERPHPPVEQGGWALESAVSRAAAFPNDFLIPTESRRKTIKVGQGAKLLFWIDSELERVPICKRMWVLVVELLPDGRYIGILESTPETPGSLVRGTRVMFGPEHVADIFTDT